MLLAALVAGCTAGSGADGSAADAKPGETTPAAAPGKYSTLPEPCRAADKGVLKDMFPEIADLPKEQQEKAYGGTPEATFDTDRQVGCRWKADSPADAHRLHIVMERVVSYDTTVSDDDQAKTLYAQKLAAAGLQEGDSSPSSTPSDDADGGASTGGKNGGQDTGKSTGKDAGKSTEKDPGKGSEEDAGKDAGKNTGKNGGETSTQGSADDGQGDGGQDGDDQGDDAQAADLQSRTLSGLGSAAFLADIPAKAGAESPQHTVRVVFRTSNVLVTVEYSEEPAEAGASPDTKSLQDKTQAMAGKLADQIAE
ncbi:DUF3558 domain-containing protein [Streptomyces sp. NPDC059398]|uniref:DUF3558 domain-containing protein n=1 Tax=Streptomyces sp. NPDC059398 TaxID=3346820 RepID=UPI0036AF013C